MDYPLMLGRVGTEIEVDGTFFDTLIVEDEAAHKDAEAAGWATFADIGKAKVANDAEDLAPPIEGDEQVEDNDKPRRGRPPKAG